MGIRRPNLRPYTNSLFSSHHTLKGGKKERPAATKRANLVVVAGRLVGRTPLFHSPPYRYPPHPSRPRPVPWCEVVAGEILGEAEVSEARGMAKMGRGKKGWVEGGEDNFPPTPTSLPCESTVAGQSNQPVGGGRRRHKLADETGAKAKGQKGHRGPFGRRRHGMIEGGGGGRHTFPADHRPKWELRNAQNINGLHHSSRPIFIPSNSPLSATFEGTVKGNWAKGKERKEKGCPGKLPPCFTALPSPSAFRLPNPSRERGDWRCARGDK